MASHLFTHFFSAIGILYGCTLFNPASDASSPPQPAYVHKFMDLDGDSVGHFINQFILASVYYGVSEEDGQTLSKEINNRYNVRCAPPVDGQLNSICQSSTCPLATQPDCMAYVNITANGSSASPQPSLGSNASSSSTNHTIAPASHSKLSSGGIAGVSIASAVVLAALTGICLFPRRKARDRSDDVPDNASVGSVYSSHQPAPPIPEDSFALSRDATTSHSVLACLPARHDSVRSYYSFPQTMSTSQYTNGTNPVMETMEIAELEAIPSAAKIANDKNEGHLLKSDRGRTCAS